MTSSMPASEQTSSTSPVLEMRGVVRSFGDVVAVAGLDLHVDRGEVVGLLGHNGAGKTTTVRLLAGVLTPEAGSVFVDGLDPVVDGPAVRRRLGVLPSSRIVDERLSAAGNLRFAAEVFGVAREGLDARITESLRVFGLEDRRDERVSGFSTGMRQRLSLARMLLPDPEVLLLDEPTAALDPIAARQVRRLVATLAQERARTVVICTHDLGEAEELCDRVVVLERGRVVAQGSPATLAASHGTGGVQVECHPDHRDAAARALSAVASEVRRDGAGRLHATSVPREAMPSLVRSLAGADVAVYEIRRLDPTLEDVYHALHEQRRDDPRPTEVPT